jgi:hypothetical protein
LKVTDVIEQRHGKNCDAAGAADGFQQKSGEDRRVNLARPGDL